MNLTHEQLNADVAEYRAAVFRLAFGCTGSRFDADDIAQEVFFKLYKYEKPFKDDEHKKAFILRVTVNLCKNLQKSAWFNKRTDYENYKETFKSAPDSVYYAVNEQESELRETILQLNPKYRAVIYLFYYEGYTAAETAKILKISESNVTTRLNRARNQLKTQLINNKEAVYE